MRIEIRVDRNQHRRWRLRLAQRLAAVAPGAAIGLRQVEGGEVLPASIERLLAIEKALLRRSRPSLCDAIGFGAPTQGAAPDIIIDLTGEGQPIVGAARALRPLYAGSLSLAAGIDCLMSGAAPHLELEDAQSGAIVANALPSLEAADGLIGGLEALFSRVIAMIEQAILSPTRSFARQPARRADRLAPGAAPYLMRNLAHRGARALYHLLCHSPHWRIGWRFLDGPGVMETGSLSGVRWNVLPEHGEGFAADPFPVQWGGECWLFYERLDYRDNKGRIFAQRFDANGPINAPALALETPWHLSYPFLIVDRDALYMVPEASVSGAVTIYRCVEFPTRWAPVGELLSGVEAADATIFEHGGRFWMMSVVRDGVGGYSDTLAIHRAPTLLGPWREHARRPALIDARSARPAGRVVERDGALWRPVQDCSRGYGKQLGLARIDRLDEENFEQTLVSAIVPGPAWPGDRLHTLNRWGRLECIDGAILTPKNPWARRLAHRAIDRQSGII